MNNQGHEQGFCDWIGCLKPGFLPVEFPENSFAILCPEHVSLAQQLDWELEPL